MQLVLGLWAVDGNVRWYVLNETFHNAKELLVCSVRGCCHERSFVIIKLGLLLSAIRIIIRI
jgi:hypothetical protein